MSDHAAFHAEPGSTARAAWRDQRGQGLPEYALLVGAVAVLAISCAMLFRTDLSALLNSVNGYVQTRAALLDGAGGDGGGTGGGNGGSSAEAPGHGNTPPGQGGTPPGQGGKK